MTLPIRVNLRQDSEAALAYLCSRWYEGEENKRSAVMQRCLLEVARREVLAELAERELVQA
jgi:hypothetical protein